ncbi:MAG: hypothetical protein IPL37_10415 [Austwickia sp.]|nr:hypothetical protein [Austwickia sp.]
MSGGGRRLDGAPATAVLRQPRPEDEIRGPGELGGVGSVPVGRGLRALAALTPYLFILLTALMVLVSWALDR